MRYIFLTTPFVLISAMGFAAALYPNTLHYTASLGMRGLALAIALLGVASVIATVKR